MKTSLTAPVFFLTLCTSVCLVGCSGAKKKDYASKQPKESAVPKKSDPPTPWKQTLGRVALVNKDMSFVLVEIGTAPAPEPGAPLLSYSDNMVSAELAVSNYQRRPFLIGDIVSGMPKVGDSVVLVSSRAGADARPIPIQEIPPRRFTPLPQTESRTEFLPSLSNEGSSVPSPRVRQGIDLESGVPALSPESAIVPPAPRMVPSEASPGRGDVLAEPASSRGSEIIPGIPVSRKRSP